MIYLVLYDYGPYDGGITIVFASKSKRKATEWLAAHNKDFTGLEVRELPLNQEVRIS